jgi:DNA polymerase/3'-5' exonuclease PolX
MNAPAQTQSQGSPIPLAVAQRWGNAIAAELQPHCHRVEIVGSIRRLRPWCNDIDIVCIPKLDVQTDMLGAVTSRKNFVIEWARDYVAKAAGRVPGPGEHQPRIIAGGEGEVEGKARRLTSQLIVQLRKCQLDIWFADESNIVSRIICRTGSREHNVWLAQRALDQDQHWFINEGLARLEDLNHHGLVPAMYEAGRRARAEGLIKPVRDEGFFYGLLGLGFISPERREISWLKRNVDSGL